ncbi:CotH kinase family protein [Chloroflexota bacterium]
MSKGRTGKGWTVCAGLVVSILLVAGGTGCARQASRQVLPAESEPFITDRVVEVRIVMKEADWHNCQVNALKEQYVPADFWFDGELVPDVAVRPKGNSSLEFVVRDGSPRLSLKVDFNLLNPVRTFRDLKKLNFHNGFRDPTFIRERLAYELFAQMGVPAPRTSHVDLWVNDTHLGLYTQVEQIDQTFLSRHFAKANGNLYKPMLPAAYLNWTEKDYKEQQTKLADIGLDYLKRMGLRTNENNPDHSTLFCFLEVLNNEPDETFPDEIEKVLDVDETLRFIAVATLIGYYDSYIGLGHNYYLYEVDGRFTIIPWDLNETFATYKCSISRKDVVNFYIDEPTCSPLEERPLVKRLLSHQPYLDTYHRYLESMLDGPFFFESMESRIDQVADLIRPFVESDGLKFFPISDFERNLINDVGRFIGLKAFVVERSSSVRRQLDGERPSAGNGSGNADIEWQSKWENRKP